MTKNELIDMMYNRQFTFNIESQNYGEPVGLYFLSEPVYKRRSRNKISISKYICIVYPETGQFEFYTTKEFSNAYTKLSTPKYDNVQDDDCFDRFATQFEDSIIRQIAAK